MSSVKEANEAFKEVIKNHLEVVQSGGWGEPTMEDLEFCGQLHALLEEPIAGTSDVPVAAQKI